MTVTSISSPSRRIAAEIRAEAARQGVSLREVSRRLGVSQPWVTRRVKVNADQDMTVEEIDRIAEALGVTSERLVAASGWLPRLDSNQQPSGYYLLFALVRRLLVTLARILCGEPRPAPAPSGPANVVDMAPRRVA